MTRYLLPAIMIGSSLTIAGCDFASAEKSAAACQMRGIEAGVEPGGPLRLHLESCMISKGYQRTDSCVMALLYYASCYRTTDPFSLEYWTQRD